MEDERGRAVVPAAVPDPVRIDAAGAAVGATAAVSLVVVAMLLAWFLRLAAVYLEGLCLACAVAIVSTLIVHRSDSVMSTADGLEVTTRGAQTCHRWADMSEVGWLGVRLLPYHRPGVLVRPKAGGPWGIPGPNSPTQVATLAVFTRSASRRARDLLAGECERHGVPFETDGWRILQNAPPGSPYRRRK